MGLQTNHVAAVIAGVLEISQAAAEACVQALVLIELYILPAARMLLVLTCADPSMLQHRKGHVLLMLAEDFPASTCTYAT